MDLLSASATSGVAVELIAPIELCNEAGRFRLRFLRPRRRDGVSEMNIISRVLPADRKTGLRCPQRILKGTFIDTYPGELITLAEAERRAEIYSETDNGSSYLFDLDKFSKIRKDEDDEDLGESQVCETVNQDEIYVVDGKNYGGVTR